jgi:hypothetical protein
VPFTNFYVKKEIDQRRHSKKNEKIPCSEYFVFALSKAMSRIDEIE